MLWFIQKHIRRPKESSIIAVTSKIVALAEGRTKKEWNEKDKEKLIRRESFAAIKTKYVWLTLKDGMLLPSAGIDESNAAGKLILLPKDSFASAQMIRNALRKKYGLKRLGVVITDSRTMPLRAGVVGVALGYAGFKGLRDYRGTKDLFGRKMIFSTTDVADSLATAAVLLMGEGREQQPLALIEDAPVEWAKRVKRDELHIPLRDDMYQPILSRLISG